MATPGSNSLPTSLIPGTGNWYIDPLLGGSKWGGGVGAGVSLSYSVPQSGAVWSGDYQRYLDNEPSQFSPLNAAQAEAFRAALQAWADVANIQFVEISETASKVGEIRVAYSGVVAATGAAAWAYLPADFPEAGDIWLDPGYAPNQTLAAGDYGYLTLLHEIGHALGLMHPFESNPALPTQYDTRQYTVMSYTDSPLYASMAYPLTPMLYDIAAIQYLYGPNMNFHTGNDNYQFSNSASTVTAIWDAGGIDTLSAKNQTLPAKLDLRQGHYSSIGPDDLGNPATQNIAIAFGAKIENARGGSGNDLLLGNAGHNILDGGPGVDTLKGGLGDDTYVIDNSGDVIVEPNAGGGVDTVASHISTALGPLLENLVLLGVADLNGRGNAGNNSLIGNAGNNSLLGGKGDDILDGGAGSDLLAGGSGLDVFVFDTLPGLGNVDTISGFSHLADTIDLSLSVFDGLTGPGALARSEYYLGSAAHDASDRIIYDSATGALYYDADGNGAGQAVQFAALDPGLKLAPTDFVVV